MNFAIPADHRIKLKESAKIDTYLDLARELKKTVEDESDYDTCSDWCARYSHQRIGTGTKELGNKRTSRDHPNNSIVKIGQNTEKRVLETCRELLSLRLRWENITSHWCEKLSKEKNNYSNMS